jgi:hypothetical protein
VDFSHIAVHFLVLQTIAQELYAMVDEVAVGERLHPEIPHKNLALCHALRGAF